MRADNQAVTTSADTSPDREPNAVDSPAIGISSNRAQAGVALPNVPLSSAAVSSGALSHSTLAAICSTNTAATDIKLAALIKRLLDNGHTIDGVLQKPVEENATGCNARLYRIGFNGQYNISQQLGAGSSSCNLDTAVLEQAAFDITNTITSDTELVVVNRFGKREAQGGGFRSVFERALELDVPVLTVVQQQWVSTWMDYGGSSVTLLNDNDTDMAQWVHHKLLRVRPEPTPTSAIASIAQCPTA